MGLFNFIYKLTIIFSNKKKLKVFIILALVIILIFAWSRGAFAYSSYSTPEQSQALTNYQLALQESFISYMKYLYRFHDNPSYSTLFDEICSNLYKYNVFVSPGNYDQDYAIFEIFIYQQVPSNNADIFTQQGEWSVGINSGTAYPCMIGNVQALGYYKIIQAGGNRQTPVKVSSNYTFHLPDACYLVRSVYIDEFLGDLGYYGQINNTTYNTSDEELQQIASSGFSDIVDATNDVNNTLSDVNSSVQDVNESVIDMIETIVDPYVNVSSQQLPTDNTTDPTSTGLNSIFTMIQTAFTGAPTSVTFPIPFTNTSFTIEPYYIENSMRKGGLATMVNVIHLYWYYRIYSFIFLKYVELLEHLKEGEFEETIGNIKKEVL